MLREVRIASPCSADWERMPGNERQRFCTECNRSVYNFSAMTAPEVEKLLAAHTGRLCARFYQRADGTMLTEDCPIGFRAKTRKVSRVAGAALSAAIGLSFASAQNTPSAPSLVQIEPAKQGIEVEVVDPTGALIPNANVSLIGPTGKEESRSITDSRGRMVFPNAPAGTYEIHVSAIGFKTVVIRQMEVPARRVATVTLSADVMMGVVVNFYPSFVETTPVTYPLLFDQTIRPVPPLVSPVAPTPTPAPRRNPIGSFFSGVGHKLGF